MKAVSLALLLSVSLTLAGAEVQLGDTLNDVRATLGVPKGQLRVGDRHLLYYDRGEIELRAGAVTRVVLMSVEDLAALEVRRARAREEREIRRTRLTAEGEALMARKLADPSFRTAPLAYQVAFWEDFSRRYPDVSDAEQLAIARSRLAEQFEQSRAQTEQAERLAELEARVNEAEARAAEVESTFQSVGTYSAYYGRSYARHPFTVWPVQYPVSVNSWQSYVTPPLPHAPATSRPSRGAGNNSDCNRRDAHGRAHGFDGGSRPFVGRNRL